MAEKVIIELEVSESGAVTSLNKVEGGVEDIGKATKKSEGGLKKFGKALGNIGKSAGIIGLIAGAFELVKTAIQGNQKLMDGINTAFTAFNIVVNDAVNVVTDIFDTVNEASGGFDAMKAVVTGLMTIAITPFKLAFYEIKLAVQGAQLIWEKSIFGSGDTAKIEELNKAILETVDEIKEVGVEAIDAALSIKDNIVEAVGEIGTLVKVAAEKGTEYYNELDLAAKISTAQQIENAKKSAAQLENQQTRIREQADRDAERQRQIRDDYTKGIDERIESNAKLGAILEQQQLDELSSVDARIANLQREQTELGFKQEIADQIYALETERFAVEAQQEGFRSEQQKNAIDLDKEKLELLGFQTQAEFDANAAKVQDEKDTADKIAAIRKKEVDSDKKAAKAKIALAKAEGDAKISTAGATLDAVAQLSGEGTAIAKGASIVQATIDTIKGVQSAFANTIGGIGIKSLAAGAALAIGIANVKKIVSVKVPKGGSSSAGGSPSIPTSTPPPNIAAPDFSINGDDGQSQLANTVQNANTTPTRAYIVSTDISDAESFDRQTENGATF